MAPERFVYAVYTNSDLTEGRGVEYVLHYCEKESTARRLGKGAYVQGGNARVERVKMYYIDGAYYAPGPYVCPPSSQDIEEEKKLEQERAKAEAKKEALEAAKRAGLTDKQIEALRH